MLFMRVLITGSSGFIGRSVCGQLSQTDIIIRALLRPCRRYDVYPYADEIVYGELPYSLPSNIMDDIDTVIHLACPTKGQNEAEANSTTVEGTSVLLDLFKAHKCKGSFIFVSSQSSKKSATSAYGKTKYLAEDLVRNAGIPYVILRPGLVIGGNNTGLFIRIVNIVKKLPFLPLPNHGDAIVQPIDVNTLSLAVERCLSLPKQRNYELNLGDPDGITFGEMMRIVSLYFSGKEKMEISFPITPIKYFVKCLNALHISFPISIDNLKGFENVEKMQTYDSLKTLGISLPPVETVIKDSISSRFVTVDGLKTLNILLIGAGKIGIVHALDLKMREGINLCGIVDRNKNVRSMYKSMGIETVYEKDIDVAIKRLHPDGIIIATPVTTHFEIAKKCIEAGIPVLLEKPVALTLPFLQEFAALARRYGNIPFHAGYMAAQYPHLDTLKNILADGTMGKILGFRALALQSHIMSSKPVSWEMMMKTSGGGVLLNYAGHLIAIIRRLFDNPNGVISRAWTRYSTEVEDAAEVVMQYDGFQGRVFASWSIEGYEAPIQKLIIDFEYGKVLFDNSCLVQYRDNKLVESLSVADYERSVHFNVASDYTGAGFSREHMNFARSIYNRESNVEYDAKNKQHMPSRFPVSLQEAISCEETIHHIYASMSDDELPVNRYSAADDLDDQIDDIINDKQLNWMTYHRSVK